MLKNVEIIHNTLIYMQLKFLINLYNSFLAFCYIFLAIVF